MQQQENYLFELLKAGFDAKPTGGRLRRVYVHALRDDSAVG